MEDLGFYFPDTLTENLGITAKKISRLNEERICELSALAALLVDFYTDMLEEGLEAQDEERFQAALSAVGDRVQRW